MKTNKIPDPTSFHPTKFKPLKKSSVSNEWMILIGLVTIIIGLVGIYLTTLFTKPTEQMPKQPAVVVEEPKKFEEPKGDNITNILAAQEKLQQFDSEDDLKIFLEQASYSGYGYSAPMMRVDMMETVQPMRSPDGMDLWGGEKTAVSTSLGLGAKAEGDFSTTNIQVAGVDEADIIKSDGKYLYVVHDKTVFIIDAHPADTAKVISEIELDSYPRDMYLNDNRLVVFGYNDMIYDTPVFRKFKRQSEYTFLEVYDIADKVNPRKVKDLDFEGGYFNSRMIGDYVYFITTVYGFSHYEGDVPMPRMFIDGKLAPSSPITDVYYFDIPYSSYNYTTVAAINIKDIAESVNKQHYLLGGSQNLYVSPNNMYITYTKYLSEDLVILEVMKDWLFGRLPEKEQQRIIEIEATPDYILNKEEKLEKIGEILERYLYSLPELDQDKLEEEFEQKVREKYDQIASELEKTIIHKISIDKNKIEYKSSGSVKGHAINQFSMDENDGYFRIATTKSRQWSYYFDDNEEESYSNVYVLDDTLAVVGKIENIAKGEEIYSTRFMQGRLYMVTFETIDPFFVIDLNDPKNPKILGELKIPGFSEYLHPLGDNYVIGLGHDTVENEWGGITREGIKLALFDVTDVANPKELDVIELGGKGSSSIALNDHKAFLFSLDKELLVIPVTLREIDPDGYWGDITFQGAVVFKATRDGFEERGKITHRKADEKEDYYYYDAAVKRSLYIQDTLYTLSDRMLKMNNLGDLKDVNKIDFPGVKDDDIVRPIPLPEPFPKPIPLLEEE